VLTSFDEPTDMELKALMGEVAREAKTRALLAQKKLTEKIEQEISNARTRAKAKHV
jgi:hypothetical protein